MKRNILIVAILTVLLLAMPVMAQPPVPTGGTTGVQVVSLQDGDTALNAIYYAEDGTQYALQGQTLAAKGASYTYFAEPNASADGPANSPDSFSGAAILSADKPIAAIANTIFDGSTKAGAYGGSSAGATAVQLPLVVKNSSGVTSIIGLQNTNTDTATDVELNCTAQDGTNVVVTKSVEAGASVIANLADEASFSDGFIGSCVVSPTDGSTPVVASAINYASNYVYAYSGLVSTGSEYFLPLIRSGFGGALTGVQVGDANPADNGDTTIDVEYSGFIDADGDFLEGAGEAYTCNVQATLPDNGSITFFNSGATNFTTLFGGSGTATVTGGDCQTNGDANFDAAGGPFLGAARVVASGSTDPQIAIVVNDLSGAISSGAYVGFQASDAGQEIISPLSRSNFFGFTTGTQVQNITDASVAVTAAYATSPASTNDTTPPDFTANIGPGASFTFFLPNQWTDNLDAEDGNANWLGSVIVSTDNGETALVGITNDLPSGTDASVFETIFVQ